MAAGRSSLICRFRKPRRDADHPAKRCDVLEPAAGDRARLVRCYAAPNILAMPKNCIICPRRNGSHEHVFPAVSGGRRTNKGIYCGLHNQKLGPLAKILSDQLNAINALLGVRPDHSDGPTRLVTENRVDGHNYVVTGQKIELAKPRVLKDTEMPDGSHQLEAMFSSQQQLQDWLAEQRTAGNQVKVLGPRTSGYAVFTEPYALRLTLGGPEGSAMSRSLSSPTTFRVLLDSTASKRSRTSFSL